MLKWKVMIVVRQQLCPHLQIKFWLLVSFQVITPLVANIHYNLYGAVYIWSALLINLDYSFGWKIDSWTFQLWCQVAADLLKRYKEKFQGGTLAVTWNYLRESMNSYLSQPNPVTARWESADHLRDPKFQLDAFRVSFILVNVIYKF